MTSLRWRLTSVMVLLTVVVLLVMDIVVYRTAADQRGTRLRQDALQQARSAAVIFASTEALVPGATLNDAAAPSALRQSVADGRSGTDVTRSDGTSRVWAAAVVGGAGPGDASGVYVNLSADVDERALTALRTSLILTSLAVVAVATALAGAISTRLVRRLGQAAQVARRIAGGDLDARIATVGRDEVAVLSHVVDDMADSVQRRIARERRFTADVAHELRTPVTGMVAAADLLPDDHPASALVRTSTERLHQLVEDLLEIARLESGRETAVNRDVDLESVLRDVAARYPVDVRIAGHARVSTDPRRLERIVANLLDNTVKYGQGPVHVDVTGRTVTVTDSGPGYPVADLGQLADPFVTTGRGTGLGLAIASEQARVIGAVLTLDNDPTGGARAVLSWPPEDTPVVSPPEDTA